MGDRGQTQVKNKQPAPMQITAEQILREARERQEDENYTAPAQKITDPEVCRPRVRLHALRGPRDRPHVPNAVRGAQELAVYRLKERKHFEDRLRMSKNAIGTWLKYAAFEEQQRDFERARSVYERAIDVDHRNTTLWLKSVAHWPEPASSSHRGLHAGLRPDAQGVASNDTASPPAHRRPPSPAPGMPRWRCAIGTLTMHAMYGTEL